MLVWLCVPFCHLQDARHLNYAASGALFSASRAASSAATLTPLLTLVSAIVSSLADGKLPPHSLAQASDHTTTAVRRSHAVAAARRVVRRAI